jgi:hypothetical protein
VADPPVCQPCWFPNINQQLVRLNFDAGKAQREDMDWRPSDLVVVGTSVSRLWLPGWQSHVRLVLAPKLLNGSFLSHSLNIIKDTFRAGSLSGYCVIQTIKHDLASCIQYKLSRCFYYRWSFSKRDKYKKKSWKGCCEL